jgi:hypothetical protein
MARKAPIALATAVASLLLAAPAFAITATPASQSHVYGSQKASVTIGDVGAADNVLLRLVRANGVVAQSYRTGPGSYEWGGKRFGTDTLTACVDNDANQVCDAPGVQATATWTQYPAIATYKNATSDMVRARFSNGIEMQFTMNAVCNPGGPFHPRQTFLTMNWTDAGGPHRFVADYTSTASCTVNGSGGLNQDIYGWGRDQFGDEYPFKIIISTNASGEPLNLRFGVGNAPPSLDWDFLDGELLKGKLRILPGT